MNITMRPNAMSLGGEGFRGGGQYDKEAAPRENFVAGKTMNITMPPNALSLGGAGFRGGGSTTRRQHHEKTLPPAIQ